MAELLDESVVVDQAETFKARQFQAEYQIIQRGRGWDLSKVNVAQLREEFQAFQASPYPNLCIADLQAFLQHKLAAMLA